MSNLVKRAAIFAERAHQGQVRKYTGEPYYNHCRAVAALVAEKGGSDAQVAAAYLHDTIEDCDITEHDIEQEFGPVVANLVIELTDQYTHESYPDKNRAERKALEAERLGSVSAEAKLVKWCDLADNTSSIVKHDPGFAVVYLREKARVLEAMGFDKAETH